MPSFPTFPWRHEPWIECFICGFAVPRSEASVHYRFKKLVCKQDMDKPTQSDLEEFQQRPVERADQTEQKVRS